MKIDLLKTSVTTLILLAVTLLIHIVPGLIILLAPFSLIPGTYLYMKSRPSFYVMTAMITVVSMIFTSIIAFQLILAILVMSYVLGYLLAGRASREIMLFIMTVLLSMYTLLSIIFLQLAGMMPTTKEWFSELKETYGMLVKNELEAGTVTKESVALFNSSLDAMQIQVPGLIVLSLFLLILLTLVITLPLLRKFKIATPNFRPLYFWEFPKIALYLYFAVSIISWFLTPGDVVLLGIVANLKYVLEWIMFIQGLSLLSFLLKIKRIPAAFGVLLFILAFLLAPVTQLFGVLDLILRMKTKIKP
ncbi:DUF2232 domain-containing protein [Macrococcus carouselicus]|uniref:DUF2232 domain-containing protein n=1 Tax=Macrococcus carouselicus TaxID=69969 RepID=A0A9Q8CIP0_9STAP|nr:DUF2232 domain-containing protein [Macrococcus carouselicus]TDM02182.1 DUF2232 domain-containing protein [Macrococcus carouselicus]